VLIAIQVQSVYAQSENGCLDMDNIRNQSYLENNFHLNCDSIQGSILELRICANLRLQREDSIMNFQLTTLKKHLKKEGDDRSLKKLEKAQSHWLIYRCDHCELQNPIHQSSSIDIIGYMNCYARITEKRAADLNEYLITLNLELMI
jgi:uncharacterized protein YecT (DUF1311 family)